MQNEISKDETICVIPSHTASSTNLSGIAVLARKLAADGRVDKVDFLIRKSTIEKLATGGEHDVAIQMSPIGINENLSVEGDVVLLVDDVTTSGNSLLACKDILLSNGASRVAMFALAQSI